MLHTINIYLHVFAGTLGMIIGIIPLIVKKGGQQHLRFGKIFLVLIGITIFTAFNGVLFFRDRPFLTLITLLSMYSAISGFRALKYKERGPGGFDLCLVIFMLGAGVLFLYKMNTSNLVWNKGVILYTVGYLGFYCLYDLLRIFKVIRLARLWLIEHIVKMTGAFTALFSAASGTVLAFWQPYNQIISAALGTSLLILVIVMYRIKWRKEYL